jgi:hypothetical protein
MTCNHTWKLYEGITNRFEYCTQCDVKKGEETVLVTEHWNKSTGEHSLKLEEATSQYDYIFQNCKGRFWKDTPSLTPDKQQEFIALTENAVRKAEKAMLEAMVFGTGVDYRPAGITSPAAMEVMEETTVQERIAKECQEFVNDTGVIPTYAFVSPKDWKEVKSAPNVHCSFGPVRVYCAPDLDHDLVVVGCDTR